MSNEETIEKEIGLLEQRYALTNKTLEDIRPILNLKSEIERQVYIQRLITTLENEQQEIRSKLGLLKKSTRTAELINVPELPKNLIAKLPPFNELKDKLLVDSSQGQRPILLLHAPSGMGKSVMAASLVRDEEVRRAFPDGIFWITLGQQPDLVPHQVAILDAINKSGNKKIPEFAELDAGMTYLREICATTSCLLIFDDVWDAQDVITFNVGSEYCQILAITNDSKLVDIIKYFIPTTKDYELKPLKQEQAIDLFIDNIEQPSITPSSVPIKMDRAVRICGLSPFVLKLIANVARNKPLSEWKATFERIQNPDYELPETGYSPALIQALHINVEEMGEEGDYYLSLAVFADYTRIPQSLVLTLWRYLYQLIDDEAYSFIKELAKKGLISVTGISKHHHISLHSFQYEYVTAEADLEKLHTHLLAIYRRQCGSHGWISGPDDGYFFEYLCVHLLNAGRKNELKSLLLDFDWINNKLKTTTLHSLLNDYELIEDDEVLNAVKNALHEAAPVLLDNKQEIATQILERLYTKSKTTQELQVLIKQAQELAPNWRYQQHFPED